MRLPNNTVRGRPPTRERLQESSIKRTAQLEEVLELPGAIDRNFKTARMAPGPFGYARRYPETA
eukprot:10777208-Alexandrium_andersonii.AAC.1